MQVLINSFGDPGGDNYEQKKLDDIKLIQDRFNKYSIESIPAKIEVRNIGCLSFNIRNQQKHVPPNIRVSYFIK